MPKQNTQFDPTQTIALAHLRDQVGLTQQEAADFFHLKDRGSIRAWEVGYSSPPPKHRARLIIYLLDKLALRKDPHRFRDLWETLMVNTWGWEPLTADEWLHYLPHVASGNGQPPTTILATLLKPALFLAPPRPTYPLLGRQTQVQALQQRLFALQDTILCGLPGVGKTALAIEVANDRTVLEHFRDGVLWARLGRNTDVLNELGKWALALGVTAPELAALTTVEARVEQVHQRIALRRMLLIIDDAWTIEAALAFQVGGPNCVRLLTTRFPALAAQIDHEQALTVAELTVDDGLALLLRLAGPVLAKATTQARQLVSAVGSLPLALILLGNAIRSALAQAPHQGLAPLIAQLLTANARLTTAAPQAPLHRHPSLPLGAKISLQAVIAVSEQALPPVAQRMLRALALFPAKPNSFSQAAALAVAAESLPTLDTLVATGLVEMSQERYSLHQTIADYANLQPPDLAATARLVDHFVGVLAANPYDYATIERDLANMQQMLHLARQQGWWSRFVQAINLFHWFAEARGLYTLSLPLLEETTIAAQQIGDEEGLVETLFHRLTIAKQWSDLAEAERLVTELTPLIAQLNKPALIIRHLIELGTVARHRYQYAQAETYWQQALDLAEATGDYKQVATLYSNLGGIASARGNYVTASQYYLQGLSIARQHATPEWLCALLLNLVVTFINCDRTDEADPYLQEGLQIARQVGHRLLLCHLLEAQGDLAGQRKAYDLASAALQEALTVAEALGNPRQIASIRCGLAELTIVTGQTALAAEHLQAALAVAQTYDDRRQASRAHGLWGKLHLTGEHWADAEAAYQQELSVARAIGERYLEADALFGLAQATQALGDQQAAQAYAQESLTIFQALGMMEAQTVQQWLASVR